MAPKESVAAKSPAEFFAENQNIAGFDNFGKSLYTTLRELVENALDAAEAVKELPDVHLSIEELTEQEFNDWRGVGKSKGKEDVALFTEKGVRKGGSEAAAAPATPGRGDAAGAGAKGAAKGGKKEPRKKGRSRNDVLYYIVRCRDNGIGMAHEDIPNMLGRVLSSSKYGVRQQRGKFGLGAKMALIWSKKSTAMPIEVVSSQRHEMSTRCSRCVLDIDIYKNQPLVQLHQRLPAGSLPAGTEITLCVGGNWGSYKGYIMHYMQQLAIITPYADLTLHFRCRADPSKDLVTRYARRSDRLPREAVEVKHHPNSVNNLLVQTLIHRTRQKHLLGLLTKELSAVTPQLARRIIATLGGDFSEKMALSELEGQHVTLLVQTLRDVSLFKAPDGGCLSPAGEYNLRLGIQKELNPDYIATSTDRAGAYEGHPFIIEAGVSLGGRDVKEGINVYRFANRIPLLFEGGADVVAMVASKRVHWASYKIDHKRDRIGVFVSIVSTKVPFKGTGKEYIGQDVTPIHDSVKRALQNCCQQLRQHMLKKRALKDQAERRKNFVRYIPDVSKAILRVLARVSDNEAPNEVEKAARKRAAERDDVSGAVQLRSTRTNDTSDAELSRKRRRLLADMQAGTLDNAALSEHLVKAVKKFDFESALEQAAEDASAGKGRNKKTRNLFVAPLQRDTRFSTAIVSHSDFSLRILPGVVGP